MLSAVWVLPLLLLSAKHLRVPSSEEKWLLVIIFSNISFCPILSFFFLLPNQTYMYDKIFDIKSQVPSPLFIASVALFLPLERLSGFQLCHVAPTVDNFQAKSYKNVKTTLWSFSFQVCSPSRNFLLVFIFTCIQVVDLKKISCFFFRSVGRLIFRSHSNNRTLIYYISTSICYTHLSLIIQKFNSEVGASKIKHTIFSFGLWLHTGITKWKSSNCWYTIARTGRQAK